MLKKTLFMALFAIAAAGARADSLWPNGAAHSGNTANMITDRRALAIGDLVTVRIIEQASAQQDTNLKTQKQASVAGTAGLGSWNNSGALPINGYGAGANENFNGGGSSARSGRIVTTLTARVISMLDSGNLVIEGRRSLKINDEKQHIYVRGVIRPGDVGRDNSIASTAISDAQIMYEGHGPLSEKSKPGFFTRLLDWLWIF
jgi:flagellar L-ring protein precursor FlgH